MVSFFLKQRTIRIGIIIHSVISFLKISGCNRDERSFEGCFPMFFSFVHHYLYRTCFGILFLSLFSLSFICIVLLTKLENLHFETYEVWTTLKLLFPSPSALFFCKKLWQHLKGSQMKALNKKMKYRKPSLGIIGSLVFMSKVDVVIDVNLFVQGLLFFLKLISSLVLLLFRGKVHIQEYKYEQPKWGVHFYHPPWKQYLHM